MAGCP